MTVMCHLRMTGVVGAAMLTVCASAGAQTTPWGDPDVQGIWTNQTPVPLQRPDRLADTPAFSEEEAAEYERTSLERLVGVLGVEAELSGELNEVWLDTQDGRVGIRRRTSLIVDPPDGRVPLTEAVRQRRAAASNEDPVPARGPEDRNLEERCITSGGVFVPNPFASNYHHILQTPRYVALFSEAMHVVRIVPLDGRAHVDAGIRLWEGDSRGWWEGRTLVIETTNFNGTRRFFGASAQLQLVERFTRLDADTIDYRVTVSDSSMFERTWT